MPTSERTYSKSEIRERRLALQQQITLEQRQLDALAKMDDAADELERVEREIAALTSGEAQPEETEQADPGAPQTIGARVLAILEEQAGTWLTPREVLAEMDKRGWTETDPAHAIGRLRHSVRRLAQSNAHVERDETSTTYRYRYVVRVEAPAPAVVLQPSLYTTPGNGYAVPAYRSPANGYTPPAFQGRQPGS